MSITSLIYSAYLACHPHGKYLLCDVGTDWLPSFLFVGFMLSILLGLASFTAWRVNHR